MLIKRASSKILIAMLVIVLATLTVFSVNAENTDLSILEPSSNQYFELRAVSVKDVEGRNKQVIFELWGYEIDFKRN